MRIFTIKTNRIKSSTALRYCASIADVAIYGGSRVDLKSQAVASLLRLTNKTRKIDPSKDENENSWETVDTVEINFQTKDGEKDEMHGAKTFGPFAIPQKYSQISPDRIRLFLEMNVDSNSSLYIDGVKTNDTMKEIPWGSGKTITLDIQNTGDDSENRVVYPVRVYRSGGWSGPGSQCGLQSLQIIETKDSPPVSFSSSPPGSGSNKNYASLEVIAYDFTGKAVFSAYQSNGYDGSTVTISVGPGNLSPYAGCTNPPSPWCGCYDVSGGTVQVPYGGSGRISIQVKNEYSGECYVTAYLQVRGAKAHWRGEPGNSYSCEYFKSISRCTPPSYSDMEPQRTETTYRPGGSSPPCPKFKALPIPPKPEKKPTAGREGQWRPIKRKIFGSCKIDLEIAIAMGLELTNTVGATCERAYQKSLELEGISFIKYFWPQAESAGWVNYRFNNFDTIYPRAEIRDYDTSTETQNICTCDAIEVSPCIDQKVRNAIIALLAVGLCVAAAKLAAVAGAAVALTAAGAACLGLSTTNGTMNTDSETNATCSNKRSVQ